MIQTTEEAPLADLLGSAVEKLDAGEVEAAHRMLVQLIRTNTTDADVIFHLALARQRLGYHVSAEALFSQAFDQGYRFPSEQNSKAVPEQPDEFVWTDSSGEVQLRLRRLPRRQNLVFVGLEKSADE